MKLSRFALITLLLLLFGCDRTKSPSSQEGPIAPGEGPISLSLEGVLNLKVTGAFESSFSGKTPVRVVTSVAEAIPKNLWLLSVGLDEPIDASGGKKMRPAFDLLGYKGDGVYKIKPVGNVAPGGTSDAFVVVGTDPTAGVKFQSVEKNCRLEVSHQGTRGSLSCPVATDGKEKISFDWSWVADPTKVLDATGNFITPKPSPAPKSKTRPAPSPSKPAAPIASPSYAGDMALTASIKPDCLTIGGKATVELVTEPRAALTIVVTYSDSRPHESSESAVSDEEGGHSYSFEVALDAPPGRGHVLISALSEDGNRSGGAIIPFEVKVAGC